MKPPVEAPRSRQSAPGDGEGEVIEGLRELQPAARDVAKLLLDAQLDRRVEQLPGLLHPVVAGDDAPGEDQRLRLGARFGEPALLHERVGPHLHRRCSGVAGAAGPISCAMRARSRSMSIGLLK